MILVIIPAFNEEKTIGKIAKDISNKFDVLVVDDGSSDDTTKAAKFNGAFVITSKKNFGVDHELIWALSMH